MPPEDVYLRFLPSPYRLLFAIAVVILAGVALVGVIVAWTQSRNHRDD